MHVRKTLVSSTCVCTFVLVLRLKYTLSKCNKVHFPKPFPAVCKCWSTPLPEFKGEVSVQFCFMQMNALLQISSSILHVLRPVIVWAIGRKEIILLFINAWYHLAEISFINAIFMERLSAFFPVGMQLSMFYILSRNRCLEGCANWCVVAYEHWKFQCMIIFSCFVQYISLSKII